MPKISRSALLSALVATVLFGSVPACVREAEFNPVAIGLVRLVLGAVGMAAIMAAQRRRGVREFCEELRREWLALVAMGAFFGVHWFTFFLAIKQAGPSIGVMGGATYGAQLPLLGWLFGFGRPRLQALAGAALALLGTWLCLPDEGWSGPVATGLAVGAVSGMFYALLPLLHQRHAHMDDEIRTWSQFTFALPVFLPLAPWASGSLTWSNVLLMLYLGVVVTLLGHYLWVKATTDLPIETTSVLSYLQLPVTLAMNWLLVSDRITASMVAGATLIVAANALALGWRSRAAEELAEGQ